MDTGYIFLELNELARMSIKDTFNFFKSDNEILHSFTPIFEDKSLFKNNNHSNVLRHYLNNEEIQALIGRYEGECLSTI